MIIDVIYERNILLQECGVCYTILCGGHINHGRFLMEDELYLHLLYAIEIHKKS